MPACTDLAVDLQIREATSSPAVYARYRGDRAPAFVIQPPVPAWLQSVLNPQSATDVNAISHTVASAFDELKKSGAAAIDLQGLDPERVQGEHLAAVLRVTYRWRQQVLGWQQALAVAEAALRRSGVDARDALTGLV